MPTNNIEPMDSKDIMKMNQEIIAFRVNTILCGLDITYVQEINKHINITKVYGSPEYISGIVNLRGQIVTIIDMRTKFGMMEVEINENMRIIVVKSGSEQIGLLVDSVEDVFEANSEHIEPAPSNVKGISGTFFEGVLKR
ncbi:MAG: chemotaxis protein CheW, partial [Candidatus Marinimicrobia bacterium]|nr:chemotaxis protein CheW [Candidatus Neomarinimicrobiota bacterium]